MEKHFFSGHAQLPSGSELYESAKFLTVLMGIDMNTGTIMEASVPLYHKMHNDFISEILIGKNIENDLDEIFKQIEKTFHTQSRRALITAIQTLYNRYIIAREKYLNTKK